MVRIDSSDLKTPEDRFLLEFVSSDSDAEDQPDDEIDEEDDEGKRENHVDEEDDKDIDLLDIIEDGESHQKIKKKKKKNIDYSNVDILPDSVLEKMREKEPLLQLDESFPQVCLLLGIPLVSKDKYEKLCTVLIKLIKEELKKKGNDIESDFQIEMPFDEEHGLSKGFGFIEFDSSFIAQNAVKCMNGYTLDSKHKFKAALLDQYEEIISRDHSYKPPIKMLGFTRELFRDWYIDSRCREQFVIRYQDETEIYWHDPYDQIPSLVYNGHRERQEGRRVWTDYRVMWSPLGTYLATFHRPGIALWAGNDFEKKVRFEHKEVKQLDFSPEENYVLTWDGSPSTLKSERAVRIWKVITGELLRAFCTPENAPRGGEFPQFIWSAKDKYIARFEMGKQIFVYTLPDMNLIKDAEGQPVTLKYPLEKFDWSPADPILSIWITGSGDAPGRLLLVEIPSRKELTAKNVYNVKGASMHWQSKGDYLCLRTVVFKKTGKKSKKEQTQLEIFRMREKDIPVDFVLIPDVAVQLHWEDGHSKRFVLVVQDETTKEQHLRLYRVSDAGAQRDTVLTQVFEISGYMNYLRWSPFGNHFVIASLGLGGALMFCAINEQDQVEILHVDDHFMVNEIKWSYCGRYLSSAVCIPMQSAQSNAAFRLGSVAGYTLWTFQGTQLYKCTKEKFYQLLWRPHPPTLLTTAEVEDIKKNIKEYSRKYEAEDERMRTELKNTYLKQRKEETEEFQKEYENLQKWERQHPLYEEWQQAWEEFDRNFEWEDKEEIIEEELDVRKEIIS